MPRPARLSPNPLKVDPRQVAIVIVDPWNYHWCMTWTEQAGGMTPRMNKALAVAPEARHVGFLGADRHRQHVLRVAAAAAGHGRPLRARAQRPQGRLPLDRALGRCLCGPGIACVVNYGWDGMDPHLEIAESDLIVSGTQEFYSICKARGITLLIYFGGATNICLTGKDIGLGPMYAAGLDTLFARDLAFAWTHYDPAQGLHADDRQRPGCRRPRAGGHPDRPFRGRAAQAEALGRSVDHRTGPHHAAGTPQRPYLFEKSVAVSLDAPFPGKRRDPLHPRRHAAHAGVAEVSTADRGLGDNHAADGGLSRTTGRCRWMARPFVRLPAVPPKPDVTLDGLRPVPDLYAEIGPVTLLPLASEDQPVLRGQAVADSRAAYAPGSACGLRPTPATT